MRPSTPPPFALAAVLLCAILVVLFADVLTVAALAAPLPGDSGAVLSPISPSTISRSYFDSSFRVSSRLLAGDRQPIVGARIDILQQVADTDHTQLISHATTGSDGSFSAIVPSGPSRTIDIAYQALEGEPVYAAQTEVFESVAAGVQLHSTRTRIGPTGTVVFNGRVLGNVPAHGVVVELLVYYQGQWQPIRTPRTSGTGEFRLAYQFHQAYGQFPFRTAVRGGQVGFPYRGAYSRSVCLIAR